MKKLIAKFYNMEIIRYVIFGAMTTLVNVVSFCLLRFFTDLSRSKANIIAIFLAMMFAFVVNKYFVFANKKNGLANSFREFISFVGSRLLSMVVEVIGTNILCDSFRCNEFVSKIIVQVAVVLINYLFGKLLVFRKEKTPIKELIKENFVVFLGLGIPLIFMLFVWVCESIGPFGGNSITMVDSLHQYLPFFSDYLYKLKNEGSLFYSWNIGLGSNFLSMLAYYMSCPLNFILVLFDQKHLYIGVCLLISIKVCLSGMSFAYYLTQKTENKKDIKIILFSTAYALSNYCIGYSWNLMWMDCILILPIIMVGYDKLIKEGKCGMYVAALFYALLCNYYIAFMICIFLVLQFILTRHGGIKKFFINGLRFAFCSLLSAGLSAFILIPAYEGLNTTAAAERILPKSSWYGSIFDMIKQLFYLTTPIKCQTFDGAVNLYCGIFCFVFVFAYLLNRKIKLLDKIRNVIILVILMVSFNNVLLNYIWHGFHDQYGIPNRFSFLFIFVLLTISYEGIYYIKEMKIGTLLVAECLSVIFLILVEKKAEITTISFEMTALFLLAYIILSVLLKCCKGKWYWAVLGMFMAVALGETLSAAGLGYSKNGYVDTSRYFGDQEDLAAAVDYINPEKRLNRAELMSTTLVDESAFYNMHSVSLFGSTVSGDLVDAMHKLGFYTGANEFLFSGASTVNTSLMGVKYILRRPGDTNIYDAVLEKSIGNVDIYNSEYALNLGYMVNKDLLKWDGGVGTVFDSVDDFMYDATGVDGVFSQIYPEVTWESDTCQVSHEMPSSILYPFTRTSSNLCELKLSFYVENEFSDVYVIAKCDGIENIRVYIDDVEYDSGRLFNQTYHVGHLNRGQKVTVEYNFPSTQADSSVAKLIIGQLNWYEYMRAYETLKANQLNITNFDDGYIKGKITAEKDQMMFTSIPYDKGWTIKVDGKKVPYDSVAGAFIAVPLDQGEHEIEMTYFPEGLKEGITISIACVLVIILIIITPMLNNIVDKKILKKN